MGPLLLLARWIIEIKEWTDVNQSRFTWLFLIWDVPGGLSVAIQAGEFYCIRLISRKEQQMLRQTFACDIAHDGSCVWA